MRRWAAAAALLAAGCARSPAPLPSTPVGKPLAVSVPLGLPPLAMPADNPVTAETVALGEKLFFSTALSVDGTISCASCHSPKTGFADTRRVSPGVSGKLGARNAPTVANAAYNSTQFWDGRAPTLEEQAEGPMMNPVEMAHSVKGIESKCAADGDLRRMFEAAYGAAPDGASPVSMARITNALAAYERTVLRGNSPFDRFLYGGETKALGDSARRGLELFRGRARCAACHLIGERSALFTDGKFHNLGVGMNAEGELTDAGRFEVTKNEKDRGAFRTPSLRNVAVTAPYMHDGSLKTLKEVVDFYVGGGNANPDRDPLIQPLTDLGRQERADLAAFLESLTGEERK